MDVESAKDTAGKVISFDDLRYSVTVQGPDGKFTKEILKGLSGIFQPGEMTALMGPSGSGKTTLLDVLSGRKTVGTIEGEFELGGSRPTLQNFRHDMGYVEQFDTLVGTLTVREMLLYTAELKRPQSEAWALKVEKVDNILKELGLEAAKDTKIGNVMERGISGGQGKRLNIGLGLVTEPAVLFLDEPTTGLDSATADDVMLLVQKLAQRGRTVVCTIHSPSSQIFRLFAKMYLLVNGDCVFFGDPHTQAVPHFESCGFPFQVGDGIADYCLYITGGGTKGNSGYDFKEAFRSSPLALAPAASYCEHASKTHKHLEEVHAPPSAFSVMRVLHEVKVLLRYRGLSNYTDGQYLGQRLGDKVLFSLILMSLYWQQGDSSSVTNLMNTSQLLLMMVILPSYGAAVYVPTLVLDRPLFFREYSDGCYHVLSYLVSKLVEEGIISIFFALYFVVVMYYGAALQGSLLVVFLTFYLCLQCGIVLAYAIGSIAPNMEAANALLPTYITVNLFFMGSFIVTSSMPDAWRWYNYIDHMSYGWKAFMINHHKDREGSKIFIDGKSVLEYYSMDDMGTAWDNLGILTLFYLIFTMFAYCGQCFLSHVKR